MQSLRDLTAEWIIMHLSRECVLQLAGLCNERINKMYEQSQDVISSYQYGETHCGHCQNRRVCTTSCNCNSCTLCDDCGEYFVKCVVCCDTCKRNQCVGCFWVHARCAICKKRFCSGCWDKFRCYVCRMSYNNCTCDQKKRRCAPCSRERKRKFTNKH